MDFITNIVNKATIKPFGSIFNFQGISQFAIHGKLQYGLFNGKTSQQSTVIIVNLINSGFKR